MSQHMPSNELKATKNRIPSNELKATKNRILTKHSAVAYNEKSTVTYLFYENFEN